MKRSGNTVTLSAVEVTKAVAEWVERQDRRSQTIVTYLQAFVGRVEVDLAPMRFVATTVPLQADRTELSSTAARLLRQVVESNGGGVSYHHLRGPETQAVRALERLGLVQGKRGHPSVVVHTRDGLAWVRAHRVESTSDRHPGAAQTP